MKPEAQSAFVAKTQQAVRDAVRFITTRASKLRGRPLRFLSRTWDMEQAPWESDQGDTILVFRLAQLGSTAPELFEQNALFEEDQLNPEWTAFDLLGQVINSVQHQPVRELPVDLGVLKSLNDYATVLKRDVSSASFPFAGAHNRTAVINNHLTDKTQEGLKITPEDRQIRIVGRLDMLRMSDRLFQLILTGGAKVRGFWTPEEHNLKPLLGEEVLMEGRASYRPNGTVASLDASGVRLATTADEAFRQIPKVFSAQLPLDLSLRGSRTFADIVGKWPGDESDAEVAAWLQEIS